MAYFNQDFLDFFIELAGNNHKDWFDENRKRYEKEVKDPFKKFVQDGIDMISEFNSEIQVEPKDCIFRINRDIRFSKDKTPYKTRVSAVISPGGKKDRTNPGIYMELSPEHFRIYSGVFGLDKEDLLAVREYIADNAKEFNKLTSDKKFTTAFGEIRGEKNKILPKHLKEAGEKTPLIFNKNWYYFAEHKPETILQEDLLEIIKDRYLISKPLGDFFTKAIRS